MARPRRVIGSRRNGLAFLSCSADRVQARPQFVIVGPSLQVQADEIECPLTDGAPGLTCQNQSGNQRDVDLNANPFRFAAPHWHIVG